MLARADVVFATSASLAERLRPRAPRGVVLVPERRGRRRSSHARTSRCPSRPSSPGCRGRARSTSATSPRTASIRRSSRAVAKSGASVVLVGPVGLGDAGSAPPALARAARRNVGARARRAAARGAARAAPTLRRGADPVPRQRAHARELPAQALGVPRGRPSGRRDAAPEPRAAGRARPRDARGGARRPSPARCSAAAADPPGRRAERLASARAHDWPAAHGDALRRRRRRACLARGSP